MQVGSSATTGRENQTVWAIHHKTRIDGGEENHGWPDASYFMRLKSECAKVGLM